MAKSQADGENKVGENMEAAQSKLSSIAEQSITANGQYRFLTRRIVFPYACNRERANNSYCFGNVSPTGM